MIVVTADQRGSRTRGDRVPDALDAVNALDGDTLVRGFERTAGDEIQGIVTDGTAAVEVVVRLARLGDWAVGVGIGGIDTPIPRSTRAASGPAYIAARDAVERARRRRPAIAVTGAAVGEAVDRAEAALLMLVALLERRTPEGWEAVDLARRGMNGVAIAQTLGITQQAVSDRLRTAHLDVTERGGALAAALLDDVDRETA